MERRTMTALATAAGAAALIAGTGAALALQSDDSKPVQLETVSDETSLETTTSVAPTTEAPTTTVEVTVTTAAPVYLAPPTTQYVAPSTTVAPYVAPPSTVDPAPTTHETVAPHTCATALAPDYCHEG